MIIQDALPGGLTLVSQTAASLIFNGATSGDLIWTKASISAGQSGTIQLCVKVNSNVSTGLTVLNVVSISGSFDSNPGGNNADIKSLTFDKRKIFIPLIRR